MKMELFFFGGQIEGIDKAPQANGEDENHKD